MSVKQTFWQLMDKYHIEIPIIQRDYAQGRRDSKAEQIRIGFIQSLHHTVIDTSESQDLDFIYGSVHHDVLTLLDGQQRLTTLFLLHWYIAAGTNNLDNATHKLSRFHYKTRVSSREFVTSLLSFGSDLSITDCCSELSEAIKDAHWFFSVWRNDPTVQSMLTMLDEIHRVFRRDLSSGNALWEKLVSENNPPITFHFLEMKEFALTDELYIKMNARGRPLTEFENLKAWLQSYVDRNPSIRLTADFWELMDKGWTDVFWKLRAKGEYEVDNLFLSYFKSIALINSALQMNASQKQLETSDDNWVIACRDNTFIPTQYYEDRHCFEGDTLNLLGELLSLAHQLQLSEEGTVGARVWKQCLSLFEGVLTRRTHQEQARFSALYLFVKKVSEDNLLGFVWDDALLHELSDWLGVTTRLSLNVAYDITMNYVSSTHVLNELIEKIDTHHVLASVATLENADMRFFNENQRSEEILKAKLIRQLPSWRERFAEYEKHSYFFHQIGFLIRGARQPNGEYDQHRFDTLASKASVLFKELLETPNFLLQRALLATGMYLVKPSHSNHSFCRSVTGNARYRYENWRRLFNSEERCSILFELLDKLERGAEKQGLQHIVETAECGDWRQYFISYPNTIRYSSKRQIRLGENSDDEVYLLNGQRMSGRYAGLRTYALYQELMGSDVAFNDCVIEYREAVGDQNRPAVIISGWQNAHLHIEYEQGEFDYRLRDEDDELLSVDLVETESFEKLVSIADGLLLKAKRNLSSSAPTRSKVVNVE